MRNRTKKEQKEIDGLMGFIILVVGLVGWYMTGTLTGVLIAVLLDLGSLLFSVYGGLLFSRKGCRNLAFRISIK